MATEADAAPARPEPGGSARLARLPFAFARRHGVLAEGATGAAPLRLCVRRGASVAAVLEAQRALAPPPAAPLGLELLDGAAFERLLARTYEGEGTAAAARSRSSPACSMTCAAVRQLEPEDLLESRDDAPVIRLINALLGQGIKEDASDIHVEPYEDHLSVRFRVDGVLREVLRPPPALGPAVTSRIKVMARLDIAERRMPQDGRIALRLAGRAVDVRVSTIPSTHGERVVLRLLDKQAGRLDIAELGMPPALEQRLSGLIHRPHGILLVTGPTGSGKTTSLYAMLTRLNDRARNILTVEDPVEYDLDGIGQTQVQAGIGLGFAQGLRAILRQDPDVIMVGEIRDLETARIAVQASLTGHLVLSTLHTNTAIGAVTRLRDMGIEPYLLASSLIGVVAQRLVRQLCPQCRRPVEAAQARDQAQALGIGSAAPDVLYGPGACEACFGRGYRGRSGLYELVEIDAPLRALIHDGAPEPQLEREARHRSPPLLAHGRELVLAGRTSAEEVQRVVQAE